MPLAQANATACCQVTERMHNGVFVRVEIGERLTRAVNPRQPTLGRRGTAQLVDKQPVLRDRENAAPNANIVAKVIDQCGCWSQQGPIFRIEGLSNQGCVGAVKKIAVSVLCRGIRCDYKADVRAIHGAEIDSILLGVATRVVGSEENEVLPRPAETRASDECCAWSYRSRLRAWGNHLVRLLSSARSNSHPRIRSCRSYPKCHREDWGRRPGRLPDHRWRESSSICYRRRIRHSGHRGTKTDASRSAFHPAVARYQRSTSERTTACSPRNERRTQACRLAEKARACHPRRRWYRAKTLRAREFRSGTRVALRKTLPNGIPPMQPER